MMVMHTHKLIQYLHIIGERSEPLSRVFNDQPCDIYIWWCPYVRTFLICMRMYARAFEYFVMEIQVLRNGRLSSLNNESRGISNVQSSYVNFRHSSCVHADC